MKSLGTTLNLESYFFFHFIFTSDSFSKKGQKQKKPGEVLSNLLLEKLLQIEDTLSGQCSDVHICNSSVRERNTNCGV